MPEATAGRVTATKLPPKYELGVNITLSAANAEADCALAASFGLKWVRTSQEMQWTADNSIGNLQRFATAAANHGLRLIQCAQGMPASLARGGRSGHYGPANDAAAQSWGEWAANCAEVVRPTGGVVSLGNEWDNYGWDTTPSSNDAATLTVAALEARDRLAPLSPMATCELAPGSSPDQLLFLEAMIKAAPSILTEEKVWIGWHPYMDPRSPANTQEPWSPLVKMQNADAYIRGAMGKHKKFLCGEFGLADGPSTWAQRLDDVTLANYVKNSYLPAFDQLRAGGLHIGPLVWYTLRDGTQPSTDWAHYCGLVDVHGNPKPVAGVLEAAAKAA